jgi:hypothetical protein
MTVTGAESSGRMDYAIKNYEKLSITKLSSLSLIMKILLN